MSKTPLSLVFEFARTDTPEDPHAFRFGPEEYTLRTSHGGRKRVHLAWSSDFLDDLDALHGPHCDPAVAQRVGRALCSFLEPSGWTWHAQAISTATQQSTPVIVTIRSAAAELYALPWEILPLEASGQCLGELPGVLVRYEWPETHTVPARWIPDARGGRILVAWSAAGGAVPAAEHIEAVYAACGAGGHDFDAGRDVIEHASVGKIADAFDRAGNDGQPIAALHLLCHGGRAGQTWGLMLNSEDPDGDPLAVDAWRLRQLLAPHAGSLRLVVVSACGSAHGREFDSVPQALHRAGIQSVVASRFPLSLPGSIRLAETLYEAMLAQQRSLEQAFLSVRKYLARDAARLDWAGLQLYARQEDGDTTHPLRAGRQEAAGAKPAPRAAQLDLGGLELSTLLELRTQVATTLSARFESAHALACVELLESDFRAGPSGPGLQKRCYELLMEASTRHQGRIFAVTTGGDSLRACYPAVKNALLAIFAFIDMVTEHNYHAAREDQLIVSIGLHHGPVLSNGKLVTGAAVDAVARIAEVAGPSELLLSQQALNQAPRVTQALGRPVSTLDVPETRETIALYALPWGGEQRLPSAVSIDGAEEVPLPRQDVIAFGRLDALADGTRANDIVLTHPDEQVQLAISRWHFELRRSRDGYVLRAVSSQTTEVDGTPVGHGEEVPVRAGTVVRVAGVMTLRFQGPKRALSVRDAATLQHVTRATRRPE